VLKNKKVAQKRNYHHWKNVINLELFAIAFIPETLDYLDETPFKAKVKVLFNWQRAKLRLQICLNPGLMELGVFEPNILSTITLLLYSY
jgi:hypothetical protein